MTTAYKHALSGDPIVAEIAERLIKTYNPERVYFFGSRARGDYRETSDYDFIVLVPDDTPVKDRDRHSSYFEAAGERVLLDAKVWTKSFFNRQLHLKASMPSTIVREGILLYAKDGKYSATNAGRPTTSEVKEETPADDDPVLIQNTRDWLSKAKMDLRGADWAFGEAKDVEYLGMSLFHSQQTVEKALKAFLTWHDYPPKKIHELEALCNDCINLDATLESILKRAPLISRWSTDGRYPNKRPDPTEEEAEDGLQIARAVFQAVLERVLPMGL